VIFVARTNFGRLNGLPSPNTTLLLPGTTQETTRFSVVVLHLPPSNRLLFAILTMTLPPFKALEAAYQLHFYLGFKTHYLRPLLRTAEQRELVSNVLKDVCAREKYHLLETAVTNDYLRLLVSLNPEQTVSRTVRMLKGNLSRQFGVAFPDELERQTTRTLWAKGYFARSSGKVSLNAARDYGESSTTLKRVVS
jgi:putative transposase